MPHGLPSATVTVRECRVITGDQQQATTMGEGHHLEILYPGADQDGWDSEVICRDERGLKWAVPRDALRL